MVGKKWETKDKVYHYYYCRNAYHKTCDFPGTAKEDFIEEHFLNWLESRIQERSVDAAIEEFQKLEQSDDPEIREKEIRKAIEEVKSRRSKWQYAWVNELISDDDFKNRMKEEDEKEKMLLDEIEALPAKEHSIDYNIKEMLVEVKKNWTYMDKYEKKQVVHMIVKNIMVDKKDRGKKFDSILIKGITPH